LVAVVLAELLVVAEVAEVLLTTLHTQYQQEHMML
jgi:hypothetical protein